MTRHLAAPALLAIVALTVAQGGAALAHANYFKSSPAPNERLDRPPDHIVIDFSEAPDPRQSGIDLLAPDGHTVASGASTTPDPTELTLVIPTIGASTYVVAWHTVSAVDGDAAHGYFAFAVGAAPATSGSSSQTVEASGTRATLTITPGAVGANDYRVQVADGSGNPLANITRVRLLVTYADRDLGTSAVVLPPTGTAYTTTGMELGLSGTYAVRIEVRRRDILDDLVYPMTVKVAAYAAATPTLSASASAVAVASPTATPSLAEPSVPLWPVVVIAAAIVAALGVWAVRRR